LLTIIENHWQPRSSFWLQAKLTHHREMSLAIPCSSRPKISFPQSHPLPTLAR
jgi:hypothetical protein